MNKKDAREHVLRARQVAFDAVGDDVVFSATDTSVRAWRRAVFDMGWDSAVVFMSAQLVAIFASDDE